MRWISIVNSILAATILLFIFLFVFPKSEETYVPVYLPPIQKELPKSLFAVSEECFQDIGENLLNLKWVPPQLQLPDLRQELIFYGKNGRPDALPGKLSFHFSLKGSEDQALVRENERAYLVYQGSYTPKILQQTSVKDSASLPGRPLWGEIFTSNEGTDRAIYAFSPGNQAMPLWFEVKNVSEQEVEIRVSMLDEKGALVSTPADLRTFHLPMQEFPKAKLGGWDLGNYRVDSTLLVRQKARWVGPDLFLQMHGGEEFAYTAGKERMDFLDGPAPYSCFLGVGDFLIWKDGCWKNVRNHEDSQGYPLLVVKKIDDKIVSFELWDAEGKGKIPLSVLRTKSQSATPNLSQEFKFVGAKTWAQFIVECRTGGRMMLKPHDWLVCTQDGWIKLDSPDLVDAYVSQKLTGPLFILEKMAKQNGRQVLLGHLFNATRTEVQEVELTSSSTSAPLANFYHQLPPLPPIQPKTLEIIGGEE